MKRVCSYSRVKRNSTHSPADFMFQLSDNEAKHLRSQFVISKKPRFCSAGVPACSLSCALIRRSWAGRSPAFGSRSPPPRDPGSGTRDFHRPAAPLSHRRRPTVEVKAGNVTGAPPMNPPAAAGGPPPSVFESVQSESSMAVRASELLKKPEKPSP